jgi:CCR4-NOT transcription complex subunit 6
MGSAGKVDGCAIFFKRSRLKLVSHFEVELNEMAASHHAEGLAKLEAQLHARPPIITSAEFEQRRAALDAAHKRLTRDNVAQMTLFSVTHSPAGVPLDPEVPLIVVNTHLFWDPQFADVKLWQMAVLVRRIEEMREKQSALYNSRLAKASGGAPSTRPIPLLLCGDLNSEPPSAVYKLLASNAASAARSGSGGGGGGGSGGSGSGGGSGGGSTGSRIELGAADLPPDPAGVLAALTAPTSRARLNHGLPLQSLYAQVTGDEPAFTNLTKEYVGTLDYVWAAADSVQALSAVEIPSAEALTGGMRHKGARRAGLGGGAFEAAGASSSHSHSSSGAFGGISSSADEPDGSEGLPNGQWPSDHLPLVFEVVLEA